MGPGVPLRTDVTQTVSQFHSPRTSTAWTETRCLEERKKNWTEARCLEERKKRERPDIHPSGNVKEALGSHTTEDGASISE